MSALRSEESAAGRRFNVFKVRYGPVMNDPDVRGVRYHTVIFVETSSDGRECGTSANKPDDLKSPRHSHNKEFIGTVLESSYSSYFDSVCRAQRAPPPQKAFNRQTMKTEQVKPDGTFYHPGEARPTLVKCTEWTEYQAIPALQQAQIIQGTQPVTYSAPSARS